MAMPRHLAVVLRTRREMGMPRHLGELWSDMAAPDAGNPSRCGCINARARARLGGVFVRRRFSQEAGDLSFTDHGTHAVLPRLLFTSLHKKLQVQQESVNFRAGLL